MGFGSENMLEGDNSDIDDDDLEAELSALTQGSHKSREKKGKNVYNKKLD